MLSRPPPATLTLLLLNLAIFFFQQRFGLQLEYWFALWPIGTFFRPWQLLTYAFLHQQVVHILVNMFALFNFGPAVERFVGAGRFTLYYLLCALTAAMTQLAVAEFDHSDAATVGASGAIFGILLAYAMFFPRTQLMVLFPPIPLPAWALVTIAGLIELFLGVTGLVPSIAHFAHLGGIATGFIYLKWLDFRSPARVWQKRVAGSAAPRTLGNGDALKTWREIRLDDLHPINREEVVRLLQKAQTQGTRSLTVEERATLNRFAGIA